MFYKMGFRWRIVEDEQMMSARRPRELNLPPLAQNPGVMTFNEKSSEVPA